MPAPGNYVNRVLKDFEYASGATHFLCIPLATKLSRPQLASSLRTLASDPCAAHVPKQAFRWLDSIHIGLGALGLYTPAAVDAAVDLVREALLRHHTICHSIGCQQIPKHPLMVSMTGLRPFASPSELTTSTLSLCATVAEPTGRLLNLCNDLYYRLLEQGLWREWKFRPGLVERFPLSVIADTRRIPSDKLMDDPTLAGLGRQVFQYRTLDATEIYRRYEHYNFTSQFPLERFSIREMGMKHQIKHGLLVNQGYGEIASIPLPGYFETQDGNPQAVHMLSIGQNKMRPPPYIVDDLPGQPSEPHSRLFRTVRSEHRKLGRGIRSGGETL